MVFSIPFTMRIFLSLVVLTVALLSSCTKQKEASAPSIPTQTFPGITADVYHTDSTLTFTSGIRAVLEDSNGNIWFGSHTEGVAMFDGQRFRYFDESSGLNNNGIRNIYEDRQGTIWFETGEGISSYESGVITPHFSRNYDFKNGWSLNQTDLWFKADPQTGYNQQEGQPGVYQYNGENFFYRAFPVELVVGQENYYSVTTPTIRSADGTLWWGTYGAAIGYDGSGFTILNNEFFKLDNQTEYLHIRALFEDSKGNLWIGNNGMSSIKYKDGAFILLNQEYGIQNNHGNILHKVFSIGEDVNGNIWFGTAGSGVWKFDGELFTNYGEFHGLPSEQIWSIYKSKDGTLWFCSAEPSGVYVFDGKSFTKRF